MQILVVKRRLPAMQLRGIVLPTVPSSPQLWERPRLQPEPAPQQTPQLPSEEPSQETAPPLQPENTVVSRLPVGGRTVRGVAIRRLEVVPVDSSTIRIVIDIETGDTYADIRVGCTRGIIDVSSDRAGGGTLLPGEATGTLVVPYTRASIVYTVKLVKAVNGAAEGFVEVREVDSRGRVRRVLARRSFVLRAGA